MIGWIDASAGVSGDMLLGALLDAGVAAEVFAQAVARVGLGVSFEASKVTRGGLRATKLDVVCPGEEQPHRTLPDVLTLLAAVSEPAVRDGAGAVFTRLADAEAAVHGVSRDEVQFHEVGALDAIADVVGVVAGFASLGLERVVCGGVGVGTGRAGAAHGSLPVPVPAVVELLRGLPVTAGPAGFEAATPTGAALLAVLVDDWAPLPAMTLERAGVGAGGRDAQTHPNVVRLLLGEPGPAAPGDDGWVQLDANVDDMDPRLWPGALDAALAAGAADAWLTPIVMKKGRPAMTVSALCERARLADVQRALLTHTTTIGVRVHPVSKVALERTTSTIVVDGQQLRVKHALLDGVERNRSIEWDDVAAAAAALGRPPKDVLAQATAVAASAVDDPEATGPE